VRASFFSRSLRLCTSSSTEPSVAAAAAADFLRGDPIIPFPPAHPDTHDRTRPDHAVQGTKCKKQERVYGTCWRNVTMIQNNSISFSCSQLTAHLQAAGLDCFLGECACSASSSVSHEESAEELLRTACGQYRSRRGPPGLRLSLQRSHSAA
jgi:hypothetical protein